VPPSSDSYVYSRLAAPNTSRLESILSTLLHGPTLTYASGLASFHALLVHVQPRVVAIGEGYHGCHGVLSIYQRLSKCEIVDIHDESSWGALGKGDLVHLETPLNPSGEAYNIAHYASLAHSRGAVLSVDATFGPPPLQDPFLHGADYIMHSGTKYFGGHSDMLCGVLAINPSLALPPSTDPSPSTQYSASSLSPTAKQAYHALLTDRLLLGATIGNLESWLGVRSLRTLSLRVQRQSTSTTTLVTYLQSQLSVPSSVVSRTISTIQHASLQIADESWLSKQMPNGYGPVFSITMQNASFARRLPSKLQLWHHATSLGGVESLVEWRRMSDATVDERLLRFSVGVEEVEDLREDVLQALQALLDEVR